MVEKYILKDNISDLFQPKYDNPESYPDQLATEYYKAQEYLESLETYYNIEKFNTKAKLDMLNKINKAYGKCNRGIENYCRIQSLEAEENSTDNNPSSDTQQNSSDNNQNNNKPVDKSKLQKTTDFLKKIHEAIVNVFNKLIEWILNLINKFRYSNKIFENTINLINNASPEEINKLSDDLKTVEFESKGILEINKHPTENLNKHLGSFDTIASVYLNAVSNANTNPKDFNRIKDFAAKLVDFTKMIPEIGNSCPKFESDGNASIKQYYDSLKTYCSSLNYNKNMAPFNKSLANSETLEGKLTVIKIIGSVDPKAIINTIKAENEAVGKINEILTKNKEKFNKSIKDISGLLRKMVSSGNKSEVEVINNQLQTLLAIEKVIVQLNSLFSGICSNVIKSVNLVKGKLIDFAKKNIDGKSSKDNKNEQLNDEKTNQNS